MIIARLLIQLVLILSIIGFIASHFWSRVWAFVGLTLVRLVQSDAHKKLNKMEKRNEDDNRHATAIEQDSADADAVRPDARGFTETLRSRLWRSARAVRGESRTDGDES